MSITPIAPTSGQTGSAPARTVDNPGATLDRDAFLKLLVAQLKYQDPTKPADASQMLAQSAQLTMVERLNDLTAASQATAATQRMALAGNIVGRDITFVDSDGTHITATVESASIENDELTVTAGGYSVPFGAIIAVHAPIVAPVVPPAPQSTPPPATTPATTPASSGDGASVGTTGDGAEASDVGAAAGVTTGTDSSDSGSDSTEVDAPAADAPTD